MKINVLAELRKLRQQVQLLESQTLNDPLTGVYNRRGFNQLIGPIFNEVSEYLKRPADRRQSVIIRSLSVLLLDVNGFKSINDHHGHNTGDKVLRMVAITLKENLRSIDIICRWGGDEFIVALVGAPAAEARKIADALDSKISALSIKHQSNTISPKVSIGVASLEKNMSLKKLIDSADRQLYKIKNKKKT